MTAMSLDIAAERKKLTNEKSSDLGKGRRSKERKTDTIRRTSKISLPGERGGGKERPLSLPSSKGEAYLAPHRDLGEKKYSSLAERGEKAFDFWGKKEFSITYRTPSRRNQRRLEREGVFTFFNIKLVGD